MIEPVADHVSSGFSGPMDIVASCFKSDSGEGGIMFYLFISLLCHGRPGLCP